MERMMDGGGYGSDPIHPGSEMGMPPESVREETGPEEQRQSAPKERARRPRRATEEGAAASRPRAKSRKSSKAGLRLGKALIGQTKSEERGRIDAGAAELAPKW